MVMSFVTISIAGLRVDGLAGLRVDGEGEMPVGIDCFGPCHRTR